MGLYLKGLYHNPHSKCSLIKPVPFTPILSFSRKVYDVKERVAGDENPPEA